MIWYVVQLREPVQWLGANGKWMDKLQHAERFRTFLEANAASEGFDVIVRTIDLPLKTVEMLIDRDMYSAYDAVMRRWGKR